MDPLSGPNLKIAMANKEVEKLWNDITEHLGPKHGNRVTYECDPQTGEHVYKAVVKSGPDPN